MHRVKLAKICRTITPLLLLAGLMPAHLPAQDTNSHIVHRPPPKSTQATPETTEFDASRESQLVGLINQARADHGLPPLTVDDRLTQAARKHTVLMADHSALSHQFEGEPTIPARFSQEGLPSDREGENVDLDQSVDGAHQVLMHSPPHRRNILDPDYNVIGVGVLRSGENIYVTEDFARRLPQYSEPEAEAVLQNVIERDAKSRGLAAPVRRPQSQLRQMACSMALNDALDNHGPARLPGVREVMVWTAGDPGKLPDQTKKRLSQGMPSGYSLGACFAPSVSHPGGVYWIIIVTY